MSIVCTVLYVLSAVVLSKSSSNSNQSQPLRKISRDAINYNYMNRSVDPCENFYEYACGNWPKADQRTKEIVSYSVFSKVGDALDNNIIRLLNTTDASSTPSENHQKTDDSPEIKARTFYQACIHSNIFQFRKIDDYVRLIKSFGGCPAFDPDWNPEQFDWVKMMALSHSYGIQVLLYQSVSAKRNSTSIKFAFTQAGLLSIPSNDAERIQSYEMNELLIQRIFIMYGIPRRRACKLALNIVRFIKKLVEIQEVKDEVYKKGPEGIPPVCDAAPFINWDDYFNITGIVVDNRTTAHLFSPTYLRRLHSLILRSDFQTVANYIAVKILFVLHSEFHHKKYPETVCEKLTLEYLPEIINRMYIDEFDNKETTKDILEMAEYIKEAFRKVLEESLWLDNCTREQALFKLNKMRVSVGLAEYTWTREELLVKYKNLTFHPTNFYENRLRYLRYTKLQKSTFIPALNTNQASSGVTTAEVNIYYSAFKNQIMIPAGILLPPFYDKDFSKVYTYGIIGSFLGHEVTHGFGQTGKAYDSEGNYVNWWSNISATNYKERAKCLTDQYNNYKIPDLNVNLNGTTTLNENIADNGGIRAAYYAYKLWYERNDNQNQVNSKLLFSTFNMTNTQLFFLSFAQGFCAHVAQVDLKTSLRDFHASSDHRVIGTLANFDEFAKEFKCSVGSAMNPINKCRLW